jgi:hypothetical protein
VEKKVDQTFEELCQHLEEHVQFLLMSSDAFDSGFEGEAKRLAVSLRVLFHDTRNSKSLLAQLGKKDTSNYIDSSMPFMEGNLLSEGGLVAMILREKRSGYVAFLDDSPIESRLVSFEKWWSDPVFRDARGSFLSRKDLILAMANQDGGAHVDPSLNKIYAELSRDNSMGHAFLVSGEPIKVAGPEKAAIRQIAHETLKMLNPDYSCRPRFDDEPYVMSVGASFRAAPEESRGPTLNERSVHSRNSVCGCGSGLRHKHCCGKLN